MAFMHPAMAGYDRAITIFSPEGKLYQVEYAGEAVKRGWPTVGVKCNSGVVIAAEKRKISTLFDPSSLDKIYLIDEHIAVSPSGLLADARMLVNYAREVALAHRFLYDEPIDVELLTKAVCDLKQQFTQFGGARPFGVALIIGGIDRGGVKLFQTDPGGIYLGYYATAIGADSNVIIEWMEKHYRFDMQMSECVEFAVRALTANVDSIEPDRVEAGFIGVENRRFRKLSMEEVSNILERVGKLRRAG